MTLNTDISHRKIAAARPALSADDIAQLLPAFEQILRSGRLILGDHTRAFEERMQACVRVPHAVAVSSCSAALQIALRYHGVDGREVVLPVNNFPGVVSIVLEEGGIPVFAEMDPATLCADPDDLLSRITARTAGFVILHVAGLVYPDIDRLRDVCERRGLFLIEDAAHALGASIDGRPAGGLGDAACFSFYPTKLVTTATGGMITTTNGALADYARSARHYGQGRKRGEFVRPGSDWAMSELHAAVGVLQLQRLDAFVAHRNAVVGWYREALAALDWVVVPEHAARFRHAYFKFPVVLAEGIDVRRFRDVMERDYHIENGTIYDPPCHRQPIFRDRLGLAAGEYPVAESGLARQFCPPIHSSITRDEVQRVVAAMKSAVENCRRG